MTAPNKRDADAMHYARPVHDGAEKLEKRGWKAVARQAPMNAAMQRDTAYTIGRATVLLRCQWQ